MGKLLAHESGLKAVDFGGEMRVLASLPADENRASYKMFASWSSEMEVLPRSKWEETEEDDFDAPVLDQSQDGSCTGYMLAMMLIMGWLRAGGKFVDFSGCFPYGLCNGGVDRGAVVSDLCEVALRVGDCTTAEVPPRMIYQRQFPKKAWTVAANYKVEKIYRISSFDELGTALHMRWLVGSGVMVGANYADLSSQGIAPLPRGGGGGHARCSYALKNINGKWYPRTRNSWSERYGMNGDCYEQEAMYGRPGSLDAFAIKFQSVDAMDNLPPVVKN